MEVDRALSHPAPERESQNFSHIVCLQWDLREAEEAPFNPPPHFTLEFRNEATDTKYPEPK